MAFESINHNFKLPLGLQIDEIFSDKLIQLIVREFHPNRRGIASRQLRTYFNRISSHPQMRVEYINKIKQLIQLEKSRGVNYSIEQADISDIFQCLIELFITSKMLLQNHYPLVFFIQFLFSFITTRLKNYHLKLTCQE